MNFLVKAHTISRNCHQVLNNFKSCSIRLTYEKSQIKTLAPIQTRFFSDEKKDDGSNNNLQLLYSGKLTQVIKYAKLFSISTSLISLSVQPWLIPKTIATGSIMATVMVLIMFGGFTFITPIALHLITNRYTINLHYDPARDVYISTNYTIFVTKKKTEFTVDDVTKPEASQLLTTCFIKGKPIFFDYNGFNDVNHYKRILGYDKPMDFMLKKPNFQSVNSAEVEQVDKK